MESDRQQKIAQVVALAEQLRKHSCERQVRLRRIFRNRQNRSSQGFLATMFAQGQLLGMQTDLLNRLKVEVNAWEKVAEKHPCAAQF